MLSKAGKYLCKILVKYELQFLVNLQDEEITTILKMNFFTDFYNNFA